MSTFTISPRGPFSLAAAQEFIAGFEPAVRPEAARDEVLRLAFPVDGFEEVAGVALREEDGIIAGEVVGATATQPVAEQAARILSLDHDATGFADVGRRDPVVGELQRRFPGLRPVLFHSPYEAAAWAVISARTRIAQAAAVKARLSEAHGEAREVAGEVLHAFPAPQRLLEVDAVPGLSAQKLSRLRGIAEAALGGALDAGRLRSLDPDRADAELRELPGIGPFYARLILLRAVGTPDELPVGEPRVRRGAALAYRLEQEPGEEEFARLAEGWRPFRTWVCLLLRVALGRGGG